MTQMIDRQPAGRGTDEGSETAVQDKTSRELQIEILLELKRLRLALYLAGKAEDLGDADALSSLAYE